MDRSHFENDKEGYYHPNYVRAKRNNLPSNFIIPLTTGIFGESNIMKAGDYIVNKGMEMEGIVISLTIDPLSKAQAVTLFCTRDEVFSLNVGKP